MQSVLRNSPGLLWKLRHYRGILLSLQCPISKSSFINALQIKHFPLRSFMSYANNVCISHQLECKRHFAKKKGSKKRVEVEEEEELSDEEEESEATYDEGSENIFTKSVPSMRFDTIMKAGLGMTKKKVEKNFYASKFRLNAEKLLKKAQVVTVGDEIDYIRGYSPENDKFLLVDKLTIKSIGKVTGNLMLPVKMEVLKGLTVENYQDPWKASSTSEME